MKKFVAVLVAAMFAAMSIAAVAQDKMEKKGGMEKKSEKMEKKSDGKKKSEKKSKDGKKKSEKKSADKMDKK